MAKTTTNISVSLEVDTIPKAKQRAEERGFKHSFSGYLAKLITEDLEAWEAEKKAAASAAEQASRPRSRK